MSQFKPADMLRAGGRKARRHLPGLIKNGLLLGLTFAQPVLPPVYYVM